MEINKQLFEDVLSGKLKGTFITRNGCKIYSDMICRNTDNFYSSEHEKECYPYMHVKNHAKTYTISGRINELYTYHFDFVDFMPDINMKQNELTIEIPDNKVVDWDESKKQNRIILKDKQLTYKDVCKKLFENKEFFFTNNTGVIESSSPVSKEYLTNAKNNSTSYHQLECILAKNMLANVAKCLNDGWKPDFSDNLRVFVIYNKSKTNTLEIDNENSLYAKDMGHIIFKSQKLAEQAIEILGEETVKLALEPLGI